MIKLDLQSRTPIYEQLKSKIGELILLDQLKHGDQLPSVRNFARDLGVNPNTVQKAYQDLERDGIIYSVVGKGSYISPKADIGAQLADMHIKKIVLAAKQAKACGISEDRVVSAIREVFREDGHND